MGSRVGRRRGEKDVERLRGIGERNANRGSNRRNEGAKKKGRGHET